MNFNILCFVSHIFLIFILRINLTIFYFVESYIFPYSGNTLSHDDSAPSNLIFNDSDTRNAFSFYRNRNVDNLHLYHIDDTAGHFKHLEGSKFVEPDYFKRKNFIVVCNLKCFLNNEMSKRMIDFYASLRFPSNIEVITCPPSIHLNSMVTKYGTMRSECSTCAQNVSHLSESFGPYTGEITAGMLKDLGVMWVMIGHSECEPFHGSKLILNSKLKIQGKNNQLINQKVLSSLKAGLNVILCIGEPKDFKSDLLTHLRTQLKESLKNVVLRGEQRLIVAYEPHHSIGTKQASDPNLVSQVIEDLKRRIEVDIDKVKFIYGGSVNEKNVEKYVRLRNLDGIMVGSVARDETIGKLINKVIEMTNPIC